jgi:PAS domain S-box-containing protein
MSDEMMAERPWKILLVEDDEDDFILTQSLLGEAKAGAFELDWADTYESAIPRLNSTDLDVVLVDYRLGSRNGLDLVREAIALGCKAPIIVFTGQDSYEVDVEAMKVGAVDYLVKGQINASMLERTIRYAIEQKQAQEAIQRARDELEIRVQERTKELAKVNEDLRAEIVERRKAEEAVASSEAKFRKLAETTSTAIFIVQDMRIRYANPAARFITGFTPDELYCMSFWEIAHPAYRHILKQYGIANSYTDSSKGDQAVLPVPVLSRYELKLLNKAGEERWVDMTAGTIEYEGSLAWVITMFDITERDLAERALREAKEELEVRVADRTVELRDANERLTIELLERKKAEDELRKARDELEQRVQERTQELGLANQDLRAEIVERLRAEDLLRQSAARSEAVAEISRMLVEIGPDYSALLDTLAESIATHVGDACLIRMRQEGGVEFQTTAFYYSDPAIREQLEAIIDRISEKIDSGISRHVTDTGKPLLFSEIDPEILAKLNAEFPVLENFKLSSMMFAPLRVQGKPVGSIGLLRPTSTPAFNQDDLVMLNSLAARTALAMANIELYEELEEALQKEQTMRRQLVQAEKHSAISRMVASVAHELNNPIQTIQNCLFLTCQEIPDSSPIQEYLDMAMSETMRVSKLVTQLREIYRPSQVAPKQYMDLVKLVSEVTQLLSPHLQHQNVQLDVKTIPNDVFVAGIPDQIKQVFLNISLNAIEAMQPDGGVLHIGMSYSPSLDLIGVSFQDNGPGISKENISKIFEPFFTTKDMGTGLGLSICYDIIQRHGGEITIESEESQGSIFTIWLPLPNEEKEDSPDGTQASR